jgi:hypothetical protein
MNAFVQRHSNSFSSPAACLRLGATRTHSLPARGHGFRINVAAYKAASQGDGGSRDRAGAEEGVEDKVSRARKHLQQSARLVFTLLPIVLV